MAGEESRSVKSSPATSKDNCPKCGIGRFGRDEDGWLKCINCGFTKAEEEAPKTVPDEILTEREKYQINDALTEQFMRAKGNARRSKLESSRVMNLEHAEFIENLMEKVRNL